MASKKAGPKPLEGMQWSLESPDDHWAQHDRTQVRYWLSLTSSERLAQAERYRVRVFGAGPYVLAPTFTILPSVVSPDEPVSHVEDE